MNKQNISIQLVIFDLDGVIVDSNESNFISLSNTLKEFGVPYSKEIDKSYNSITTKEKLTRLNVPPELITTIVNKKQHYLDTLKLVYNADIRSIMAALHEKNIKIAIASNARRKFIERVINELDISNFITYYVSGQDKNIGTKPSPAIYLHVMSKLSISPKHTIIVEDSIIGKESAQLSSDNIFGIVKIPDLTIYSFFEYLEKVNSNMQKLKYINSNLNVLIPMAGKGERFCRAGYTKPKPLIDIDGKPMIVNVVNNLHISANYIFIVQQAHIDQFAIDSLLKSYYPDCKIVTVDGLTEGAACTVLKAEELINNDSPLLIVNSDNLIEWDHINTMNDIEQSECDGAILTIPATGTKWSYVKTDEVGLATEVAEKIAISENATTGHYYWRKGSDFVTAAKVMIDRNMRYNSEFYVAPVYNIAIERGAKIITKQIDEFWSVGTPEDLNYFHTFCKKDRL